MSRPGIVFEIRSKRREEIMRGSIERAERAVVFSAEAIRLWRRDDLRLARFEPGRKLFLAVPYSIFVSTLHEPIARPVLEDLAVACLAFDPRQEVIITWTT